MDQLQKDVTSQTEQTGNSKNFLKAEPQVLGVAQILIGVTAVYLWGINQFIRESRWCYLIFEIGFPIWGSVFFFVSGALSIAAGRKMTLTLIRSSLAMNVLSAVIAGIGAIIETIEESTKWSFCPHFRPCAAGILLLCLLEASIAISLSVFGCKVICFVTQVVVIQSSNNPSSVPAPYAHEYEELQFQ